MNKSIFPTLMAGGVKAYSWRGGPVDELLLEFLSFHFPGNGPIEFSAVDGVRGIYSDIFKELPFGIRINVFARGCVSLSSKVCPWSSTKISFINDIVIITEAGGTGVIKRDIILAICEFKSFFENWASPKTEELDILSLVYPEADLSILRSLVIQ